VPDAAPAGPTGEEPVPDAFRARVTEILAKLVAGRREALAPLGPDLDPFFDAALVAVSGGKRLRAAFAYWGWRAAGGSPSSTDSILNAAAAIELVHASALVHDDVIDASATRRGGPAAQRAFAALRRSETPDAEPGAADQFGGSAAILLGDLLLAWSDELFTQSGFKPKALAGGRVYFDKLRNEVVAGQYLDVLAQTRRRSSAADAMRVLLYKSAKYTVERPLQLGAALAKTDGDLLRSLSSYGVPLGEAFQLRDDLLGVFGRADLTGKPSGDDIREGKRTLLMARAFDKGDEAQRVLLDAALGNADLDDRGIAEVHQVLAATGAVTAVETVISELTSAALATLRHAPLKDEEARTALRTLGDRATNRTA